MEDSNTHSNKSTILNISLHQYVFDFLQESNKRLFRPLEPVYLYYCAQLFEKYLHSDQYFKTEQLGLALLESSNINHGLKNDKIQEVAEKSFLTCAYFGDSKKAQIVGINYYAQLCRQSFFLLNDLRPVYLENKNFFLNYACKTTLLFSILNDLKQDRQIQTFWDLFQSHQA